MNRKEIVEKAVVAVSKSLEVKTHSNDAVSIRELSVALATLMAIEVKETDERN